MLGIFQSLGLAVDGNNKSYWTSGTHVEKMRGENADEYGFCAHFSSMTYRMILLNFINRFEWLLFFFYFV